MPRPVYLTLPAAILKGAAMHPKAKFTRHDWNGHSCVLGAIEDAVGRSRDPFLGLQGVPSAETAFPVLHELFDCPAPLIGRARLNAIMADLNNGRFWSPLEGRKEFRPWSRERIAKWVETLGLKQKARVVA